MTVNDNAMPPVTETFIHQQLEEALRRRHIPRATYRLQFNAGFTFRDAERLVPYLHQLGISDLYAAPIQLATPGSTHGYDVCDPGQINPELGGMDGFLRLSETLERYGMGWLQDIVPNHMGIEGDCNAWWLSVLENGPSSPYAAFFDIDWDPVKPELLNKVLLPILEDQYGIVLDSGRFTLEYGEGAFRLRYGDRALPIAPRTYPHILDPLAEMMLETLGAEDESTLELQSIMTAAAHLPPPDATEPEAVEEKQREQAVIRRRLAALFESSETAREALAETLRRLNGLPGDPRSFDRLDALINAQSYRMAFWRVAGEEINYRRFFDINTMAALRNELPAVFAATHDLFFDLLAAGKMNGLRVDHPDGLWDPPGYFRALQETFLNRTVCAGHDLTDAERAEVEAAVGAWLSEQMAMHEHVEWPLYVVAEKILSDDEPLPPDWAVYGTTGYDFMNQVNGLFVDAGAAAQFDRIYREFTGVDVRIPDLEYASKLKIMRESLAGEINSIAHQLERLAECNRHTRDFTLNGLLSALREVIACLGIYRTYITGSDAVSQRDQFFVEEAVKEAQRRNPRMSQTIFYFLRDTLLLRNYYDFPEAERAGLLHFVMRFQQISAPVMAKSVEDTAFYIYNRLVSLNEVGGSPAVFGVSPDEFHEKSAERLKAWPHAMLSLSTHDTKRSEDARARLNVLSEMPDEWAGALQRWHDFNASHKTGTPDGMWPDANDEYLLYQALLAAWPGGEAAGDDDWQAFTERIAGYMAKATKEAKVHTSWTYPNDTYDQAVREFVLKLLDRVENRAFLDDLEPFQRRVAFYGRLISLSQTLLKLTVPGMPDTYRGTESWDFSLVDPDNRRPVDYARLAAQLEAMPAPDTLDEATRAALLADLLATPEDGRVKLFLTATALRFRRDHETLFRHGTYLPLAAGGDKAGHVCAFAREHGDEALLVVVPRLVVGLTGGAEQLPLGEAVWGETALALPETLRGHTFTDVLSGVSVRTDAEGNLHVAEVLRRFPVALLAL